MKPPTGITNDQWASIAALQKQRKAHLTELRGGSDAEQLNIQRIRPLLSKDYGAVPLTVLTAGKPPFSNPRRIAALDQLAHKSTRGKQIVVADSGHFIQYDAPQAVVSAVNEMLMEMRRDSPR